MKAITKQKNKTAVIILVCIAGIIAAIGLLNVFVIFRLKALENIVEAQKKELNRNVAAQVTEIIHDPVYMSDGNNAVEAKYLMNTKELLSEEEITQLKNDLIDEIQAYVTDEVYMGVKELLITDFKESLYEAVEVNTENSLSDEQQDFINSLIQEMVVEETAEAITKIRDEMTTDNKVLQTLETKVTSLNFRMDTLEKSLNSTLSELEAKDKELEAAINKLRISFVSSNVGTTDLSILSVQMATNMNVLAECENALLSDVTALTESDKNTYLTALDSYRSQVKELDNAIQKALSAGDLEASENLAESAAYVSKNIAEFGTVIEQEKISLDTVKNQLQGKIDSLEKTSSENLTTAVKTIEENVDSLIGVIPEGSSVADQILQTKTELTDTKINLESAITEVDVNAAIAIQEAQNNASEELEAAKSEIQDSLDIKANKEDLEGVMRAEITTDENGKTTIRISVD